MGVVFRSRSSVPVSAGVNTVIPPPDGIADGDILVILQYVEANATPPPGFTPYTNVAPLLFPVNIGRLYAWWKRAKGELGNYTVTHASAGRNAVMLAYIGGVRSGSVEDVAPSTNTGNADPTLEVGSIDVRNPGTMVLYASATWDNYALNPPPPAGTNPVFTERYDPFTETAFLHAADGVAQAGPTGSKIVTNGPAANDWVAALLTIKAHVPGLVYDGIMLTAPVAPTPFTADPTLYGYDVIVTNTSGNATITGPNGVVMAIIAAGRPFRFGGKKPVTGEPIRLADYSATAAAGDVHISYSTRV